MNIYLISLLLVFQTSMTRTPNFYPSYIAAREASKNYQKDLLIFFSKSGCAECDAAWANFEKDQYATKVYISTLVDAADFDGIVLWDKYNFKTVPAWVVLNPDGQLKDKWSGDWKKTPTRPVGETTKAPEVKATTPTATSSRSTNTARCCITWTATASRRVPRASGRPPGLRATGKQYWCPRRARADGR